MIQSKNFSYAINGLVFFLKTEANARIHFLCTVIALLLCFILPCNPVEIVLIIGVSGLVWVTELFNTAIEESMDMISPERDPKIKIIKDVAAGAVLVAALTALLTGAIIFLPKLI
jgi:diacylglycerol kinase